MNVCILIPAWNEAKAIGRVVSAVCKLVESVAVVDDGSKDETAQIARDSGAFVISHAVNKGKGAALRTGFQHVLDSGYDAVITMDGDGQHDPDDIPVFLSAFEERGSGIVLGSRMRDTADMPAIRRFSNRLSSFIGSLIVRQRLEDSQSGFRLISADVLRAIKLESTGYEMESEILIKASRAGFRISSVPIKTIYGDETSTVDPVADTCRIIRMVFRSFRS